MFYLFRKAAERLALAALRCPTMNRAGFISLRRKIIILGARTSKVRCTLCSAAIMLFDRVSGRQNQDSQRNHAINYREKDIRFIHSVTAFLVNPMQTSHSQNGSSLCERGNPSIVKLIALSISFRIAI